MDLCEDKLNSEEVATLVQMIPHLDLPHRIEVLDLMSDTILCECNEQGLTSPELKSELLQAMGLAWQIIFLELYETKADDLFDKAASTFMVIYNTISEVSPEFVEARKILKSNETVN